MNRPVFNALWLFLMPAILVILIVSLSQVLSLRYISEQQTEGSEKVYIGLNVLNQAIGLVLQVGLLHDRVSEQLHEAQQGRLDEAGAYRIHVFVVDHLSHIEQQLNELVPRFQKAALNQQQIDDWQQQFMTYRNLVIMATDIVSIEPKTASNYVQQAQSIFFTLSAQTFSLTSQLSAQATNQIQVCLINTKNSFTTSHIFIVLAIIIALLVAFFSSRYLARQLQTLMIQMNLLSNHQTVPDRLPRVEALTNSSSAEIKRLALSILNFHQAMKAKANEEQRNYSLLFHDPLTGLSNRNKMLYLLKEVLTTRQADEAQMGLIKLNLNRLKVVNDGLGYSFGDQLLIQVSQYLQQHTPHLHTLSRSSGDEFILLINGLTIKEEEKELISIMHHIHHIMLSPFHLGEHDITISVAMGATIFPNPNAPLDSAETIFTQAMLALHSAKKLTKEQSLIYHPDLETQAKQRVILESQLRTAIEQRHLCLYLQPQVNAQGKMLSAETLVRWQDPEKGLISPAVFIPIAEQTDLIIDLDRWVLTEACLLLKQVQDAGIAFSLAINISGKHFAQDNFVDTICGIIEQTQVNPSQIMLELTEGVFISDLGSVVDKMNRLNKVGIQFSIDDFGTGYSSLQYLKRLPIHELKIDKSFIDGLPDSAEDVALVKTMISIAQNLDLTLVIEGVETQAQVDFLKSQGDFMMQGYYFAKPQPAQAILSQLGVLQFEQAPVA